MKNIAYKNIAIFLFLIIFIILNTGKSKAVLQANGNESAIYTIEDWMLNVRKMEELGGAMGLEEILNTDLTSSSTSNNIDVHMEKNTEYGALAILSASSYGNPNKVEDGNTTTGNSTGVVMKINREWVAAFDQNRVYGEASRYSNLYERNTEKNGDATEETKGWHGSGTSVWFDQGMMARSLLGSIFSFHASWRPVAGTSGYGAYSSSTYATRAVVVSGEGL